MYLIANPLAQARLLTGSGLSLGQKSLLKMQMKHLKRTKQLHGGSFLSGLKSVLSKAGSAIAGFGSKLLANPKLTKSIAKAGKSLVSAGANWLGSKIAAATAPQEASPEQLQQHYANIQQFTAPVADAVTESASTVGRLAHSAASQLAAAAAAEDRKVALEEAKRQLRAEAALALDDIGARASRAGENIAQAGAEQLAARSMIGSAIQSLKRSQRGGLLRLEPMLAAGDKSVRLQKMAAAALNSAQAAALPARLRASLGAAAKE